MTVRETFYLTSSPIRQNFSFHENYNILAQIAEAGQYGTAYRCEQKISSKKYVVKIIDKRKIYKMTSSPLKDSLIKSLKDEVNILQQLKHDYIIKLHDLYETENNVFIVMNECKGGELFDKIIEKRGYKESEAKKIFKMIVEAVFYLHNTHKVVHSDLKPGNILFVNNCDSSPVCLIDFGMAKILPPFTSCKQLCGTPYYTAPEVIECDYSHCADMWSLGALLFTMMFGYPAFYVDINKYQGMEETYQIYKLIKKGFDPCVKSGFGAWFPRDIVEMDGISSECMDLMSSLMTSDVRKRLTAKEVLQHEWLTGSINKSTENY